MKYEKVSLEEKLIAGVKERTSSAMEREYEEAKIPALWGSYFQSSILFPIPDECEDSPAYALYCEYEDGTRGEFDILVGTEVSQTKNLKDCYAYAKIVKGEYLRFDANGPMPKTLIKLWEDIWNFFEKTNEFQRVFKSDFEVYSGENDVSIYIGIKKS